MSGRENQRRRTRKALLEAAANLAREGRKPSLEEVAEAALVSRATAYRYFPSVEALLTEAALDLAMPEADALYRGLPANPVARLQRLDDALDELLLENETQFRMMLANSMAQALEEGASHEGPLRQNRRSPLIEAALEGESLAPAAKARLARALAVLIGTEAMVVFKDVLQASPAEAKATKRWAIQALVEAARR